jgi:hypothetical protein
VYRLYAKANLLLSADQWPAWIPFSDDIAGLLDKVYVVEHTITASETAISLLVKVLFEGEVAFALPGLDAVSLAVGVPDVPLPPVPPGGGEEEEIENPDDLYIYETGAPEGWTELTFAIRLTSEEFTFRIVDVSTELRVDQSLLRQPGTDLPAAIGLRGDLVLASGSENVTFEPKAEFALPRCEIGSTGIVVSAANVVLDPSTVESPQEILDAGFDASFVGAYFRGATVEFPLQRVNDDGSVSEDRVTIELANAVLGTGGVSGAFSTSDLGIHASLLGFDFVVDDIAIDIRQNALVEARLSGALTIPFFKSEDGGPLTVQVDASLGLDGDWSVAISEEQDGTHTVDDGIVTVPLGSFGSVSMASITIASIDGIGHVTITGTLALAQQAGVALPSVTLSGLTIDTTGRIAIEGGQLDLPQPKRVELANLLTMEVSRVGFGQDGAAIWVSLDGGIALPEPLPMSATFDGLRAAWLPGTTQVTLTLGAIGVGFEIPDVLTFSGFAGVDFALSQVSGAVDVALLPMGLAIGAGFGIGSENDVRYFLFDIEADLPVGIPLGPFVGLFGMSGMFAYNLLANPEGLDWLEWFEEREASPDPLEGWSPQAGAFGLGAGVTLGSLPDNGFTIAVKSGLALLLPGPVIALQGEGNVLKPRSELEASEPLFDALAVFDGAAKEIQLSLSANYEIPHVLTMQGTAEAFFDLDDGDDWFIHVGEKKPERRLRADVLDGLLHGDAYLMIQPDEIAVGASIGLGDSWTFTPVTVTMEAGIDASGEVSWSPQHYEASLALEGQCSVGVGPIEYGYAFEADAEGEAPSDEHILFHIKGEILLPWPLPDVSVETTLSWDSKTIPEPVSPIISSVEVFEYRATEGASLGESETTAPVVGLDACFAIAFGRPAADDVGAGTVVPNASAGIDQVGKYRLDYHLTDLRIDKWNEETNAWEGPVEVQGSWQNGGGTQLWIGPRSPFAGTQWLVEEGSGATNVTTYLDSLFADEWFPFGPPIDATEVCRDFATHVEGETLGPLWAEDGVLFATAEPVVVRRVGDEVGIPLSGVPLIIAFAREGPVGALSIRCTGTTAIVVRATLDGGRPAPDAFVAGFEGGPLPADWRGLTSISLEAKFTPGTIQAVLLEVCWVPETTLDQIDSRQDAIDLATESSSGWTGAWSTMTPGLYRLTCEAQAFRDSVLVASDAAVGYFRCEDPPADLTPYVDATVPAPGQRPVFRKYDLAFTFRESYVEEMYGGALIADVIDLDGTKAPPEPIPSGLEPHTWLPADEGEDVALVRWCEHAATLGIEAPDAEDIVTPDVLRVSLADVKLEPGRPYRARLTTGGNSLFEVPFVASKFEGFAELVGSFDGRVWNEALSWTDETARDEALVALAEVAADATRAGFDATGALFDRVYVGAFGLRARPWPSSLEVRALRWGDAGYGFVVDLPEAVGLARLAVSASAPAGTPVSIPSPDGSRVVIVVLDGPDVVVAVNGAYRMDLTFRRRVAENASLPILTRGGSSADETAAVAFTLQSP